jgi:hypothetical protein
MKWSVKRRLKNFGLTVVVFFVLLVVVFVPRIFIHGVFQQLIRKVNPPLSERIPELPKEMRDFRMESTLMTKDQKPLNPKFPVIEGEYQMTKNWSVTLPDRFNRRFEDNDLVLWKPGFTVWVTVWGNTHDESREARLAKLNHEISKEAFDTQVVHENGILRLAYRLKEAAKDTRVAAFCGFAVGSSGHVQVGIYFDDEGEVELAKTIWRSLRESPEAAIRSK